jgi:hypothetical protein
LQRFEGLMDTRGLLVATVLHVDRQLLRELIGKLRGVALRSGSGDQRIAQ